MNERRSQASGTAITDVSTTPAVHQYGAGFEQRWFAYSRTTTRNDREAGGSSNGQLIRTTVLNNLVDATTGTLYDATTTTTEPTSANGAQAGAAYVERVYQPTAEFETDWTHWCFGVPGRIETTHSHSQYGGTAITLASNLTWDTSNCRVAQEIIQPGALQITRTLAYDNFGNLNSDSVQGAGMPARVTALFWGVEGRFLRDVTNALSQKTQFTWNAKLGLRNSLTDPNLIVTHWQQDGFGRRTREDRPDGTATTWSYENCTVGGCVSSSNRMRVTETVYASDGSVTTERHLYLDSFERAIAGSERLFSGAYNRVGREFDAFGRVARETAPCWWAACSPFSTSYHYDLLHRITQLSRPVSDSNPTVQNSYNYYEGLTTRSVDALGKQSARTINVLGTLARSTDHDGYSQSFDYNALGNAVRVTDNLSNTLLTNTFNDRGMLTAQTDIAAGTLSYIPNALGEVVQQTDAKGQVTSFDYDLLGRMIARQETEGTSLFTFGTSASARNIGQLASMSGPGYVEGFTYDASGRLQQKTITSDATYTIGYTYNTAGLLDTLAYPTSTSSYRLALQYEYQNGSLWRVKNFNAPATVYWTVNDTDARGNVINETRGNGIQTISGYDAVTGSLDYVQSGSGGSVQDLSYSWDHVGNLATRQDVRQGLTESYTYDNLYRVVNVTGPDPMTVGYDPRGNILSRTGGVSSDSGHTVTWYSYNLPNTITAGAGGSSSQFFYGPHRARWKQVATYGSTSEQTTYIGDGLLEKVTLGGVTSWRHYIAGSNRPVAVYTRKSNGTEELHYLTTDHLGSIDTISNASGAVEVRLSFGSFGQRRNEAGWFGNSTASDWAEITDSTRQGYTGHEMLDNLNLIHMNGRVYDPLVARFLSPDPYIDRPGRTQGWNRYSYVHNRPLSLKDPSGYQYVYNYQNRDIETVTVTASRWTTSAAVRGGGGTGGSSSDGTGEAVEEMGDRAVRASLRKCCRCLRGLAIADVRWIAQSAGRKRSSLRHATRP